MIWIASFPRSGNTYLRNILFEVYGLESSTFHMDSDYPLDSDYESYPFVKTHLLPSQLKPSDKAIKSVYLVRDGRDAMCSIAHHRKDIVAPGSDYYENLKAAIIAERGTFFGGWSTNVTHWVQRADIVIRYEDLLVDPIKEVERLREVMDLPQPNLDKFPSFKQMKFGIPEYGSGKNRGISEDEMKDLSVKNFRKGKAGSWKEEMPEEMQDLFWSYHGETMSQLGYSWNGELVPLNSDLDYTISKKLGHKTIKPKAYRVLIESSKLLSSDNDGVKRYQIGLLKALWPITESVEPKWNIDLLLDGEIIPLKDCKEFVFSSFAIEDLNKESGRVEGRRSLFQIVEQAIVNAVPDKFVAYLNRKNITIFHAVYNFIRKIFFDLIGVLRKALDFIFRLIYQLKEFVLGSSTTKSKDVFDNYDLIHMPLMQHYKPFLKNVKPIVVTMHDLTHRYLPSYHTSINISNAEKGLGFIEEKQADIISVSKSTLEDTIKETSLTSDKLHLVYEAADNSKFSYSNNSEDNLNVLKKYNLNNKLPYLLCLSTIEPRKNLSNTIKAFTNLLEENPDLYINLVIAGKKGWATDSLFMHNKLLSERIIFTGFVDDEDLSALYSEAWALCYVSYYEGFGLPALEAMRCGTPVIYGNNSSMPEIVGEGGLPADPDSIVEIKNCMLKICQDQELRNNLSILALKQSLSFSWRKAAIETLDVYEEIINRNKK